MKRSIQTTIAAVLSALFGIFNIAFSVPALALGAEEANAQAAINNPPYFILVLGIIMGGIGLVAVWGLWKNQKWAKIATLVIMAMGILGALPGVLWAETTGLRMAAIAGVVLPLIIIVLLLWPSPQRVVELADS
jgi:uncharacterized membrane protein